MHGYPEGRIGLFDSYTCSVKVIAKFHGWYELYDIPTAQKAIARFYNCYEPCEVATTQNKVNSFCSLF